MWFSQRLAGNLFGLEPDPDWETALSRLLTGSYDHLTFILLRLALQATIYFIWRERNERKHNSNNKSVDQVAKLINKSVRNRISSTNYVLNPKLQGDDTLV
ncbi:BnaC08g48870D [Brassica napus]|uniref:BnaC08g48870D protein n=1 Tax=Brassica napus TaxID=3708 RepID=A0A078J481_BRANA|nr:BnaC08g48870D [Brassica napus]